MPILSRKDLERISRRVLFRYLTLSDRKMDRIDPVDFAEKICGLHFAFADMSVPHHRLGRMANKCADGVSPTPP